MLGWALNLGFAGGGPETTELVGRRRKTKFYTGPIWPPEIKEEPKTPDELFRRADEILKAVIFQEDLKQAETLLRNLKTAAKALEVQRKYQRHIAKRLKELEEELEEDEIILLH